MTGACSDDTLQCLNTLAMEEKSSYFDGAVFAGTGVVTDGLILTSGICPYMQLKGNRKDGTKELALALAAAMRGK